MGKLIDLTGKVFSRLTVCRRDGSDKFAAAKWECRCVCGQMTTVVGYNLTKGTTKSCGCFKKDRTVETHTTHGMGGILTKRTAEYDAYGQAKQRCTNPKNKNWKDYGGRGIKFLFTSFEQFFAELGFRPEGKTLDRIENDGNYEPGNVQWSTPKEQQNNRRISQHA